uniref:Uncharacterized protein n=1 Tax=Timema shepardi TaxID=629360 RepID=A0A7R9FZ86_TIMSH|nr:unnamed protein product [Timema shepardi]
MDCSSSYYILEGRTSASTAEEETGSLDVWVVGFTTSTPRESRLMFQVFYKYPNPSDLFAQGLNLAQEAQRNPRNAEYLMYTLFVAEEKLKDVVEYVDERDPLLFGSRYITDTLVTVGGFVSPSYGILLLDNQGVKQGVLFHYRDLYINNIKCTSMRPLDEYIKVGKALHCTAGKLREVHQTGACYKASCVWDRKKPSCNQVFEKFLTSLKETVKLAPGSIRDAVVVAFHPPNTALVVANVNDNLVPLLLFVDQLHLGKDELKLSRDSWIEDYLEVDDILEVKIAVLAGKWNKNRLQLIEEAFKVKKENQNLTKLVTAWKLELKKSFDFEEIYTFNDFNFSSVDGGVDDLLNNRLTQESYCEETPPPPPPPPPPLPLQTIITNKMSGIENKIKVVVETAQTKDPCLGAITESELINPHALENQDWHSFNVGTHNTAKTRTRDDENISIRNVQNNKKAQEKIIYSMEHSTSSNNEENDGLSDITHLEYKGVVDGVSKVSGTILFKINNKMSKALFYKSKVVIGGCPIGKGNDLCDLISLGTPVTFSVEPYSLNNISYRAASVVVTSGNTNHAHESNGECNLKSSDKTDTDKSPASNPQPFDARLEVDLSNVETTLAGILGLSNDFVKNFDGQSVHLPGLDQTINNMDLKVQTMSDAMQKIAPGELYQVVADIFKDYAKKERVASSKDKRLKKSSTLVDNTGFTIQLKGQPGKVKEISEDGGTIELIIAEKVLQVVFKKEAVYFPKKNTGGSLVDLLPVGKEVFFDGEDLRHRVDLGCSGIYVFSVYTGKRPKKLAAYKEMRVPVTFSDTKDLLLQGKAYQGVVSEVRPPMAFVVKVKHESSYHSVFVFGLNFSPGKDANKLVDGESVKLFIDVGDYVFVTVQKADNNKEFEWVATEAWTETDKYDRSLAKESLFSWDKSKCPEPECAFKGTVTKIMPDLGILESSGNLIYFNRKNAFLFGICLESFDLTNIFFKAVELNTTSALANYATEADEELHYDYFPMEKDLEAENDNSEETVSVQAWFGSRAAPDSCDALARTMFDLDFYCTSRNLNTLLLTALINELGKIREHIEANMKESKSEMETCSDSYSEEELEEEEEGGKVTRYSETGKVDKTGKEVSTNMTNMDGEVSKPKTGDEFALVDKVIHTSVKTSGSTFVNGLCSPKDNREIVSTNGSKPLQNTCETTRGGLKNTILRDPKHNSGISNALGAIKKCTIGDSTSKKTFSKFKRKQKPVIGQGEKQHLLKDNVKELKYFQAKFKMDSTKPSQEEANSDPAVKEPIEVSSSYLETGETSELPGNSNVNFIFSSDTKEFLQSCVREVMKDMVGSKILLEEPLEVYWQFMIEEAKAQMKDSACRNVTAGRRDTSEMHNPSVPEGSVSHRPLNRKETDTKYINKGTQTVSTGMILYLGVTSDE